MKTKTMLLIFALLCSSSTWAKTARSAAARAEFEREHPCPATHATSGPCPGYIVDHVTALGCGGADAPENMQWQTVQEAAAKDKTERIGCEGGKEVAAQPMHGNGGNCGGKHTCSQMGSCAEAQHYFKDCGVSRLDRDHDGIPCESLCQ